MEAHRLENISIADYIQIEKETDTKYEYHDGKIFAMAVCGQIERSDREANAIVNPVVIVEVLSKSTESYDRGDKFFTYRQIESLIEYVLIEQQKAQIEIYQRTGDLWKITRITGREARFSLAALGIELNLANIYENIDCSVDS